MSNEESLEQLALVALALKIKADKAKTDYETAKSNFIEALRAKDMFNENTHAIGHVKTDFTPNRWFDADAAFASLPKKAQKECLVEVPDAKLIQAHLTPIQREKFMKDRDVPFKVSLSVLED